MWPQNFPEAKNRDNRPFPQSCLVLLSDAEAENVGKRQCLLGYQGNASFLETYWRHIFLTYPLALAGSDSLQNPNSLLNNVEQRRQMLQFWGDYVEGLASEKKVLMGNFSHGVA